MGIDSKPFEKQRIATRCGSARGDQILQTDTISLGFRFPFIGIKNHSYIDTLCGFLPKTVPEQLEDVFDCWRLN